jgi:hypothetical protein
MEMPGVVLSEDERRLQYDDGVSNGQPGPGYGVCTIISVEDKCIVRRDDGQYVGWVADAQTSAKDDHSSFLLSLEQGIKCQQELHPGQVVVLVVDGARTHTTLPGGRDGVSINLFAGPNNLKDLLTSVGKWDDSYSLAEARELWGSLPESRGRWSEAEEIAERLGAILLYLPLAHPYINPIEMLWRAMKVHYRKFPTRDMRAMLDAIEEYMGFAEKEMECSFERHHTMAVETRRFLYHNPGKSRPSENALNKKGYQPEKPVPTREFSKLLGLPTIAKANVNDKLDVVVLQRYAHWLNQARIYGSGKKKVFCECVE